MSFQPLLKVKIEWKEELKKGETKKLIISVSTFEWKVICKQITNYHHQKLDNKVVEITITTLYYLDMYKIHILNYVKPNTYMSTKVVVLILSLVRIKKLFWKNLRTEGGFREEEYIGDYTKESNISHQT